MTVQKPLTTGKIATHCRVNFKTVLKWIEDGKLESHKLPSGENRIEVEDFLSFLAEYKMPIPSEFKNNLSNRVLIIDDDPGIVSTLQRILYDIDVEVDTASNGFDAGFKISTFNPSLLLLDLRMPAVNGYDVAAKVKGDEKTKHIKIVIMSAHVEEFGKERLESLGVDAILDKPFKVDEVIQLVKQHLHI